MEQGDLGQWDPCSMVHLLHLTELYVSEAYMQKEKVSEEVGDSRVACRNLTGNPTVLQIHEVTSLGAGEGARFCPWGLHKEPSPGTQYHLGTSDFLLLILGFSKEQQSTLCEKWSHHRQSVDSMGSGQRGLLGSTIWLSHSLASELRVLLYPP